MLIFCSGSNISLLAYFHTTKRARKESTTANRSWVSLRSQSLDLPLIRSDNGYSTTSYGAQGGAGGGGFFAQSGSQDQGSRDKGYNKDTLRPVTIKQLLDAQQPHPDADFKIDGAELTQVTFVGQVRNVSQQATNFTYKLDDGTGTIEVKQWIDADLAETGQQGKNRLQEDGYARVWGKLKSFNNKRHVGSMVMRPVADFNEVQYHLLEATAVHLYFTKGPLGGAKQANGDHGATNGYDNGNAGKKQMPAGLSAGARKMYATLQNSPTTHEGLHVQELSVKASMEVNDVLKAADELLNHGMVYTTVDDQTWAILDDI